MRRPKPTTNVPMWVCAKEGYMSLVRSITDTVEERALRDLAFQRGLLNEAIEAFLSNDTATGKLLLRDYVNATVGFEKLGDDLDKSPKNLMHMLSAHSNPRAGNIFAVIAYLRDQDGGASKLPSDASTTVR